MATNKNFVIKNGLIVNGSEVITSAGNLTNIGTISSGTISSGAITASGDITANSGYIKIGASSTNEGGELTLLRPTSGTTDINIDNYQNYLRVHANGGIWATIDSGGISGNSYQVLGTTVINSSRNLTNIGTISSGAITSTGDISADDGRVRIGNPTTLSGRSSIRIDANGDSFADLLFGDNTSSLGWTNANWSISSRSSAENNSLKIYRGSGQPSPYNSEFVLMELKKDNSVSVNGVLQINNTNVIDASRNLTNIASIDSTDGFMTFETSDTNGYARFTAANGSAQLGLFRSGSSAGGMYIGGEGAGLELRNSSFSTKATLSQTGVFNVVSSYQLNGTTVIDSSRNLTNIENITSNGALNFGANTTSGRFDIAVGSQTSSRGMVFTPYTTFGTRYSAWDTWIGQNARVAVGQEDANIKLASSVTGLGASAINVGFYGLNYYSWSSSQLSGLSSGSNLTLGQAKFSITGGGDLQLGGTTVIDASRNITSSQLYMGSWTPSNATSVGRIGRVTDRPAGSITNQLGTNSSSRWEIVDYDWTVVLAKVTDAGNFTASGNVTAYSDERLKTNIQTLDSKKALQMRGVSFIKDGVEGSGVIAQEIEEIAPELVITADDEMGTKSVAYGNLVGYLIEAIKDQQKDIEKLKEEVSSLRSKI